MTDQSLAPASDAATSVTRPRATRRSVLASGLAAVAAVALAACGSRTGDTGSSGTAGGTAATRTFETSFGTVKIPEQPARVVCVDHYTPGALLDAGCTPVGVAELGAATWLAEYEPTIASITHVGISNQVDLEKVASLKPDLILGTYLSHAPDPNAKRYEEIAPTVLFEAKAAGDWKERSLMAADAVGKRSQGEAVKHAYEEHAATIKQRFGDTLARTKWSMVQGGQSGQWALALPDSWGGVVLMDAGIQFAGASANQTGTVKAYSYEQLNALDDSDVILVQADNAGQVSERAQPVLQQPAWQSLKAARGGHVYPLLYFNPLHYRQADAMLARVEEIIGRL